MTVARLTDDELDAELAYARFCARLGGTLGYRTHVADRIRELECEMLRRCLDAS